MIDSEVLRRTALFAAHRALGARIVPFAGFEMPVQYAGIVREHEAVRRRAGLFDLSHMAQFELRGNDVAAWADALTVNHVASMKPYGARYNVFTNDAGGALDDVIFYRLPDRWLLVVNAANAAKMWTHLTDRRSGDVELENLHGSRALIAIQGPHATSILSTAAESSLDALRYYSCIEATVFGRRALVARTGYTGEDGFELFLDADDATAVWDGFLDDGRDRGLEPAGLGARDVLRLEAGMPLYGYELDEAITPLQAGLERIVRFGKMFVGKAALEAQRDADTYLRIAGLVLDGRVPARTGYPVSAGGRNVGTVRSGTFSPSGGHNIATALVEKAATAVGESVTVSVRGVEHAATVVSLPFYSRPRPRI